MDPGTEDKERETTGEIWRRCHQPAHEGLGRVKAAPGDTHTITTRLVLGKTGGRPHKKLKQGVRAVGGQSLGGGL